MIQPGPQMDKKSTEVHIALSRFGSADSVATRMRELGVRVELG